MTEPVNDQPSSRPAKTVSPDTSLSWFKTKAYEELEAVRYLPSVQVALRQHLRLAFWLTRGQPLTREAVERACKAVSIADATQGAAPVPTAQTNVDAVLCKELGFVQEVVPDTGEFLGWVIPDMLEMLEHAGRSYQEGAAARSARAKKAATARWTETRSSEPKPPQQAAVAQGAPPATQGHSLADF